MTTDAAPGRHPFHSACSYLGCFPPHVPRRLLSRLQPGTGHVLDPFCGSGTTLVEAKLAGLPSVGIDLSPLAVALSLGKVQDVDECDVQFRLSELASGYRARAWDDVDTDNLERIFHPLTLAQLLYLRGELNAERPEDAFLRMALLGIMHGKARQDGSTAYLSVNMPNTFSMSPRYINAFVERNGLSAPRVDVFAQLRRRTKWLLREGIPGYGTDARVIAGSATRLATLLADAEIDDISAVVTSPPYLGVLRYGAFNWIRLWLLGSDQYTVDHMLDGTASLDRYLSFLTSFLVELGQVVRPGVPVAMVIGDVVENDRQVELASRVWEEIESVVPFELVELLTDGFDVEAKTTRIWGTEKRGRATPLDRILILRRRSVWHGLPIEITPLPPSSSTAAPANEVVDVRPDAVTPR